MAASAPLDEELLAFCEQPRALLFAEWLIVSGRLTGVSRMHDGDTARTAEESGCEKKR
jgi:hypothetical protein